MKEEKGERREEAVLGCTTSDALVGNCSRYMVALFFSSSTGFHPLQLDDQLITHSLPEVLFDIISDYP